jgi:prepilin-type N-terminal cleavage/methylation domain-containing protein/prepilin-type processing-associated H-X9-DG protein
MENVMTRIRKGGYLVKEKGFTLIELLVVIAIIAILAAILFPVFAKAREKAMQSTCASNLKQLGTSISMYCNDFDETYPCGAYLDSVTNKSVLWADDRVIGPYLKSHKILYCPTVMGNVNSSSNFADLGNFSYTYGVNRRVFPTNSTSVRVADVKQPGETIFMADSFTTAANSTYQTCYYMMFNPTALSGIPNWWVPDPTAAAGGRMTQRHNEGANILWGDGHVLWKKLPSEVTKDDTYWDLN